MGFKPEAFCFEKSIDIDVTSPGIMFVEDTGDNIEMDNVEKDKLEW